jgi:TonB-linked SusC/RagA family outer membrane protein
LLSPYKKDADGNILEEYDVYRFGVSNPVAIVNTLEAGNKQYDVNLRLGLNYALNENLKLSGVVGLFYNYNQESIFIPGRTSMTIVPMNNDLAENTVRTGVGETKNMFFNLNAYYRKVFNDVHALNFSVGTQVLSTNREYDAGAGFNTASDFYQTLDYVESGSEKFYGYINEWNWMNVYGHGDYTWNNLLRTSVNVAVDGSSSSGLDAERLGVFPSAGITFMSKNLKGLMNSSFLNRMDFRAEYGMTGNSRFSANYAKNYYHSAPFMSLSGIVRSNIPNTGLQWERTKQLDLGIDLSLFRHRLDVSVDYYSSESTDVLFGQPISPVFGSTVYYSNSASLENKGLELSFSAALLQSKNFEWVVGGNLATAESEITSLGNVNESIITFGDDAQVITRVGEKPYSFYGYVAEGVFASQAEASAAGLSNWRGAAFGAGDVQYQDVNGDKIIDDDDRQLLGSAAPDFFGGFYSSVRISNFTLSAEFIYSVGNDAYNAVRRSNESMDSFGNQSMAAVNRWQFDGQATDIPRAYYGDPMDNNAFSSRWIEDASFVKMKSVTLDYRFEKTMLGFFRSGTIYVTGENLFTWTDYLGLDPEFSYSYNDAIQGMDYSKVVLPRTVKFGFNLKF